MSAANLRTSRRDTLSTTRSPRPWGHPDSRYALTAKLCDPFPGNTGSIPDDRTNLAAEASARAPPAEAGNSLKTGLQQ